MDLSLWNVYDWLSGRGFSVEAAIDPGLPLFYGIRFLAPEDPLPPELARLHASGSATAIEAGGGRISVKDTLASVLNAVQECFEFYNRWEGNLAELALKEEPFQEMVDLSAKVLPYPLAVCNMNTKALAISKWQGPEPEYFSYLREHGMMPLARMREIAERDDASEVFTSREARIVYENHGGTPQPGHLRGNIWQGASLMGFIIAFNTGSGFRQGDTHLMDVFRFWVEKCAVRRNSFPFSGSVLGEHLALMLDGDVDVSADASPPGDIAGVLHNMGWHYHSEYAALRIEQRALRQMTPFLRRTGERIQYRFRESCVFVHGGSLALLFNSTRAKQTGSGDLGALEEFLADGNLIAGASYVFHSLAGFPAAFRQAGRALDFLRGLPEGGGIQPKSRISLLRFSDIAIAEMGRLARSSPDLALMIHPDVSRLLEHDRQTGSAHAETLFRFLFSGNSMTAAAEMAGVHRNTMIYRIEKIRKLLSLDPNREGDRLLLFVSCILAGVGQ